MGPKKILDSTEGGVFNATVRGKGYMKQHLEAYRQKAREIYRLSGEWFSRTVMAFATATIARAKSDPRERNRVLIIALSLVFILDYLMFSLHIEKNIFDIFPSVPLLDRYQSVTVYLPSIDKNGIFEELREIPEYETDEGTVKHLFTLVSKGSIYENTSISVPVTMRVRKIWFVGSGGGGRDCVIDVDAEPLVGDGLVIKGSESLFRKALEKTIIRNIDSVKSVTYLEKGIQGRPLWEMVL
jgi:hypothetical protein